MAKLYKTEALKDYVGKTVSFTSKLERSPVYCKVDESRDGKWYELSFFKEDPETFHDFPYAGTSVRKEDTVSLTTRVRSRGIRITNLPMVWTAELFESIAEK